jgi:hypothetical protein
MVVVSDIGTAGADDDRRVGVVVQGTAVHRERLATHLARKLEREGYVAVDEPVSRGALDTLLNCFILEDLVCARGVIEARAKTPRLVFARIEEQDAALQLDITWFAAGHAPQSERESCRDCGERWREHADAMLSKLAAGAPMPIVVPSGATSGEPERRRSRWLPRSLVVAGALSLVAGGVYLYYGTRDGADHKYVYPQLTPVGITLLAVGGGATIGGVLWSREF